MMNTSNTLTQDQLNEMIQKHSDWLNGNEEGVQADFSNMTLRGLNFGKTSLTKALFDRAILDDSIFTWSDLIDASMRFSSACNVNFDHAVMNGLDASSSSFSGSSFKEAHAHYAKFKEANMRNLVVTSSTFNDCDMTASRWQGSRLIDSGFDGSNLSGSKLNNTTIEACTMSRVIGDGLRVKSLQLWGLSFAYTHDILYIDSTAYLITNEHEMGEEIAEDFGEYVGRNIGTVFAVMKASPAVSRPFVYGYSN